MATYVLLSAHFVTLTNKLHLINLAEVDHWWVFQTFCKIRLLIRKFILHKSIEQFGVAGRKWIDLLGLVQLFLNVSSWHRDISPVRSNEFQQDHKGWLLHTLGLAQIIGVHARSDGEAGSVPRPVRQNFDLDMRIRRASSRSSPAHGCSGCHMPGADSAAVDWGMWWDMGRPEESDQSLQDRKRGNGKILQREHGTVSRSSTPANYKRKGSATMILLCNQSPGPSRKCAICWTGRGYVRRRTIWISIHWV